MNKLILLVFSVLYTFASIAQVAPEANPHRGLYVDHFLKTTNAGVMDPAFSILAVDTNRDGIFEKEDALLQYCSENHVTYIALYDMQKILGRNRTAWNENTRSYDLLEKHLCRFMDKAKNVYCIDQIGAIGGSASAFDSLQTYYERYPVTSAYRLRPEQINSMYIDPVLYMVERDYEDGSDEQNLAEHLKFWLRVSDYNDCGTCGADFDYILSEDEFWNSCVSEFPRFSIFLQHMNTVKQMHNSIAPQSAWKTEVYLGTLYFCLSPYMLLDIARLLDGCNNCSPCPTCPNPHPKLIDRVLLSYLTADPGVYNHFATTPFRDPSTTDSTDFHPILYSESTDLGGSTSYLGKWFTLYFANNIFMAEMYFYNSWRASALLNNPQENVVQPGGAMWFAQSYHVLPLKKPSVFFPNTPICDSSGNALLTFTYTGPAENGTKFEFWISRNSDSAIVYPASGQIINGTSNAHQPAGSSGPERRAINFNDTSIFPVCHLPAGEYTAHMNLNYEFGDACSYSFDQNLVIDTKPQLTLWGDSVFCEGHYTWLRASNGSFYQWYRDTTLIPGATQIMYKAEKTGNYHCLVTGNAGCSGHTDTIHINVRPNPIVKINAHCNGSSNVTLIAHVKDTLQTANRFGDGGVTYLWNTGETTDRITVNFTGERHSLNVTDPYTGCSHFDVMYVPGAASSNVGYTIQPVSTPSSACSNDGSLQAVFSPGQSGSINYFWNTGELTQSISNLYPGTWSVTSSIWAAACSYYATYNLGPLPTGGPLISGTVTNVSCHGSNDGAIQVQLSGGTAPFTFFWDHIPDEGAYNPRQQNQSALYPGRYTVSVFDGNGCRFQESFTVSVNNPEITVTLGTVNPVTLCSTNNDGSASVSASGGNGPYTYQWNDPLNQTGSSALNLPSGTWSCYVSDVNGCSVRKLVSIPSTPPIRAELSDSIITFLECNGDSTGYLSVCMYGGIPPYQVASPWTMIDSVHASATGLAAGTYLLNITDANGCLHTESYNIYDPLAIQIQSSVSHTTCIGCEDGSIAITSTGGTGAHNISWNPSIGILNGTTIDSLPAGVYEICVEDAAGCSVCINDTVLADPLLVSEFSREEFSYSIYPNPSGRFVHILLNNLIAGYTFELQVSDISGRVIEIIPLRRQADQFISHQLSSGMYISRLLVNGKAQLKHQQKWMVLKDD